MRLRAKEIEDLRGNRFDLFYQQSFTSLPLLYRTTGPRLRLIAATCQSCHTINYPPTLICYKCGKSGSFERVKLSRKGRIHTFSTVVLEGVPYSKDIVPYTLAVVELSEGVRVFGEVVDAKPEDIRIDLPVEVVFRKVLETQDGLLQYGIKFRPILDDEMR